MPDTTAENELINRTKQELGVLLPGFDDAIIGTLMDLLMDLVTNCFDGGGNDDITPQQAVHKVKNLSPLRRAAFKAQLKKRARLDGVRDANNVAPLAVQAVEKVAKSATPAECEAFAAYLIPIAKNEFEML